MSYEGEKVYRRGWRGKPGVIVGTRRCQLESCNGNRLITRWPDGHRTMPCSMGCEWSSKKKAWVIL